MLRTLVDSRTTLADDSFSQIQCQKTVDDVSLIGLVKPAFEIWLLNEDDDDVGADEFEEEEDGDELEDDELEEEEFDEEELEEEELDDDFDELDDDDDDNGDFADDDL